MRVRQVNGRQSVCEIQDQYTAVAENEENNGNYVNPSVGSDSNVATAFAENHAISVVTTVHSLQCLREYMTVFKDEQLCRADMQGKTAALCTCMYSSAVPAHDH